MIKPSVEYVALAVNQLNQNKIKAIQKVHIKAALFVHNTYTNRTLIYSCVTNIVK